MEGWLLYALLVSVLWACYSIVIKIVASDKYMGLSPAHVALFMLIGFAGVVAALFWKEGSPVNTLSKNSMAFAVGAGVLCAIAVIVSIKTMTAGADVSKFTPIANTSTLFVVFLGMTLLQEIPTGTGLWKVIAGAVFIMVGGILLSG